MPFDFPADPQTNDTYSYSGNTWIYTGNYWALSQGSGGGPGQNLLDSIDDVTIVAPTVGQTLVYNGTEWVNNTGGGGGGGDYSQLSIVTATAAPQASLVYNGLLGEFTFTPNTELSLPIATPTVLGGIRPDNITVTVDGTGYATAVRPKIYPAATNLNVSFNGAIAYLFSSYSGNNPTLTFTAGTTVAFNLAVSGHPFYIQTSVGANYDTGLVHVGSNDALSTGSNAQGKITGTLYWNIPSDLVGQYRYICGAHANMVGTINIINNSIESFQDIDVQNTYNFNSGTIFYTSGRTANWQASFTNVPIIENSVTVFTIIINQGSTGYYPSTILVNSTSISISWAGGITPSPGANKKEIVTFTIYYKGSAFSVLGNLSTYG